jgi:very-short-patch-repair endonuclease
MPGTDEIKEAMPPTEESADLRIQAGLAGKLNLADFQNAVPLVRELSLANASDRRFNSLELTLTSEPAFLQPRTWHLDLLGPGQELRLTDLDVRLDGAVFSRLTEAEQARVCFTLCQGQDPTLLAMQEQRVELLPRNQWGGMGHLPEMLAAFVQPNEPAVERILKQAAEWLHRHGKPSGLDGYAGGAKRAWELAGAIWGAVAALNLDYALPPASFEVAGQKVRGPGQILESGLATCLDLALLFAAACEQVGLNPLLVLKQGHAFAGVWLKAEEFSSVVVDDITSLRKRVRLNELILFEPTLVTQHPAPPFSFAIQVGAEHVSEAKEADFHLALDVRRARLQRIKPLASAWATGTFERAEPAVVVEPAFEEAPELSDEPEGVEPVPADLDPKDRLARWQRKLLDLSLKNNLLNFRENKRTLRLVAPNPGALEDLLAQGETLKLLPMPDLMDGSDPRSQAIHEARTREVLHREHACEALQRHEVFVTLPQSDLDARLVEQYRAARTAVQEGGANTLFLAMGFLSWTRAEKGSQRFRAPMILIPVSLSRRSARSGFTLALHEDEPRFNPTLLEMLRQDHQLNLGILEGELPQDDSGLDIAGIWRKVSQAIKDIPGWEVSEDVVLALFSFAKHLMWKDLTERTDQLRENPVVRHLIDTPRDAYPSTVAFPDPRTLDRTYPPGQVFCPLQADSSQLSAVLAATRGKDFVLIGPPGTGKSQTIANLIAQGLAEGRKVLFVSEKIAALDVVHRRLREVGLGEFCLELHSNKARKQDVLAKLQVAWQAKGAVDQAHWQAEAERLGVLRERLNRYVERMHERHRNGWTLYRAIAQIVQGDGFPRLGLTWAGPEVHSEADLEALRDLVDRLEVNARAVGQGALVGHSLAPVACTEWSPLWQQRLVASALGVAQACDGLERAAGDFIQAYRLPEFRLTFAVRNGLANLARLLPEAAGRDWRFVLLPEAPRLASRLRDGYQWVEHHREISARLSPGWSEAHLQQCARGLALVARYRTLQDQLGPGYPLEVIEAFHKGLGLLDQMAQARASLSVAYTDSAEGLDIYSLQRDWNRAVVAIWPRSWFGKRRVRQALERTTRGDGHLDTGHDVKILAAIRTWSDELSGIDIGPATEGLWAARKTNPVNATCTLAFQEALNAGRQGRSWVDAGFEPIAEGRCGGRLAQQLGILRELAGIRTEILTLDGLSSVTGGLWQGLDTPTDCLEAALAFQEELRGIRVTGALVGAHSRVRSGECGPILAQDIRCLQDRLGIEVRIATFADLVEVTAGLWAGLATRGDELNAVLAFQEAMTATLAGMAGRPDGIVALVGALVHLLGNGNALLHREGPGRAAGQAYLEAFSALQPALAALAAECAWGPEVGEVLEGQPSSDLAIWCRQLAAQEAHLHAWCAWRKVRREGLGVGLGPLVAAIEQGTLAGGTFRAAFEADYCRWWVNTEVDADETIRTFVSAEHEKCIEDFRALDGRFSQLTKAWVRARLCADIPDPDTFPKNSDWGLLRYELSKKRKHMPLRDLVTQIPGALTHLAPCLLMSPLSIAQYLPAEASTFDLVVFDEASQIPVWDAIGAIARGRQAVIVGDPKQLPPTNFFNRAESESDAEDVEEDLESILDECLGANLPTLRLGWHYRSRHESLIAFSNHQYYGDQLVTFPSPVTRDQAVSLHPVAGVYEKGSSRINKPEARALVADVVRRLRSPEGRQTKRTIGIVTFNAEQQTLIENLLDEERRRHPDLEAHFAEGELEPLFVKNLESVQGDERDIIYFSTTYGPDLAGTVSMNFGPLNRDGGERRLNVAITRARYELRVFSSLKAEQINLARTQARGVRDLKWFLDFAERGSRALAEASQPGQGGYESPFEEAVAAALERMGWQIHTQVGVSAYRIDLAVVHPDKPGAYLAGVECDGATYHRSATARDRDKLREAVLRGLGWEILRVWSTDWWIDSRGTLAKLQEKLEVLLETSRKTPEGGMPGGGEAEPMLEPGIPEDAQLIASQVGSSEAAPANGSDAGPLPDGPVEGLEAQEFFNAAYDSTLVRLIDQVIQQEGPVLDAVLARRIARMHGFQRTGGRIQARVDEIAERTHEFTREAVGRFLARRCFVWVIGGIGRADFLSRAEGPVSWGFLFA